MLQWYPEIKHHMADRPFILVGTKEDLRSNPKVIDGLRSEGKSVLTEADGQRLAAELGAARYVECSALTQVGLKNVFDQAIITAIEFKRNERGKKKGKCVIM